MSLESQYAAQVGVRLGEWDGILGIGPPSLATVTFFVTSCKFLLDHIVPLTDQVSMDEP